MRRTGPVIPRRVVLIGGGYVTICAYRALMRRAGHLVRAGRLEVVVVSADHAHSFHGFTGEVVAGILPFSRTRTTLTDVLGDARVLHARVTHVDTGSRTVRFVGVRDGARGELGYDQLVVGTGGIEPVATVPGLAEHGHTLRGPGDIARLAARVAQVADGARPGGARPVVLVAGGGLAGVELAAAAADRGRGRVHVVLVHSGDRLLPELADQPRLARRARAELARLGVTVRLGTRLDRVAAEGAHLSDGTLVPAAVVLGTVGQRAIALPGLTGRDERDRLLTSPDLQVADGVWAAGDAARVVRPGTTEPVPTNALWAIKAGAHAGDNVARALLGQAARPFTYRGLGRAASFGLGRSICELYGVPFTGGVAWLLRLVFFLRFMPSRRTALAVLGDLVHRAGPDRAPTQRFSGESAPSDVLPRLERADSRPLVGVRAR